MMARNSAREHLLGGSLTALAQTAGGVLCTSLSSLLKKAGEHGWAVALAGLASANLATAAPILIAVTVMGGAAVIQELLKSRKDRELTKKLKALDTQDKTALEMLRPILESVTSLTQRPPAYSPEQVDEWVKAAQGQDLKSIERAFVDDVAGLLAGAGLATETHLNEACDLLGGVWVVVIDSNERIRLIQEALADLQQRRDEGQPVPTATDNFLEAGVTVNQDFLGRDRELEELHTRLEEGNVAIVHALTGEGGVGKTELAKAYALSHADDYVGRWWLDASDDAIEASTAAVLEAVTANPPDPQATPEQIRIALCRALSEGKHLLVLDNVEDPKRLEAFSLSAPSRVLVTTRHTNLPRALVTPFEVEVLEREAAVALLRKHRDDLSGPGHKEALGSVVEFLGCHTLAVALAGEYLRKYPNVTPQQLLERLEEEEVGAKGFTLEEIESNELGTRYRRNVAASLGLHLPEFAETPAMVLLGLIAFCHPTGIPFDLLCAAVKLDDREVERWLARLGERSIIAYTKTVGIHRLTQSLIRQRLGEDGQRTALTALVGALIPKFEGADDHAQWASMDAYAPHALATLLHAQRLGVIERAGFVANQVGVYLQGRVRLDDALGAYQTAERIDRAAFGDNHPEVASHFNNIGWVLQAKGDLDGALEKFREADRIGRAAFGDDHPKVAIRVNNIGSVLQDKGDLDGALEKYREAERIDRGALGDDHPRVGIRVNNIGDVLREKGDLEGALEKFREAERIGRAAFGDDHPHVAICVNNIGSVLKAKGDLDGALVKFREAERIDRAAFGDDHPKVAIRVSNIGAVLLARGDRRGAAECMTTAFRIFLRAYGPRGGYTVTGAENLLGLGIDPIAIAREVSGDEVATELDVALRE